MRVKAKFSDGHIVPLEPLEIEEGAELSVEISEGGARQFGARTSRAD